MIVIGLTGSIGMGKSTIASQLAILGVKTINADVIVHGLLAQGGKAVPEVEKHFPGVVHNGSVDRKKLGSIVFHDDKRKLQLESIIHPLVRQVELDFIKCERAMGAKVVALDIPLLFETGGESMCDVTLVTTATHFIQRQRVMRRPNMTEEKFHAILARQMPDGEKRARADFVVHTGLGKASSLRQIKAMLRMLNIQ
jgi:dephospho-CoA kinase